MNATQVTDAMRQVEDAIPLLTTDELTRVMTLVAMRLSATGWEASGLTPDDVRRGMESVARHEGVPGREFFADLRRRRPG